MGRTPPSTWLGRPQFPRSRHPLYGPGLDGRPGREYRPGGRWYRWDNLRIYLGIALAIFLAGVLITDCTNGTTEHVQATVQERCYHPAYWSPTLHSIGRGKKRTYYYSHDYHPAWWEVVVQDWEGVQHVNCSETYYYQVKPGQVVPVSYRRGRWTHWRWGTSCDND